MTTLPTLDHASDSALGGIEAALIAQAAFSAFATNPWGRPSRRGTSPIDWLDDLMSSNGDSVLRPNLVVATTGHSVVYHPRPAGEASPEGNDAEGADAIARRFESGCTVIGTAGEYPRLELRAGQTAFVARLDQGRLYFATLLAIFDRLNVYIVDDESQEPAGAGAPIVGDETEFPLSVEELEHLVFQIGSCLLGAMVQNMWLMADTLGLACRTSWFPTGEGYGETRVPSPAYPASYAVLNDLVAGSEPARIAAAEYIDFCVGRHGRCPISFPSLRWDSALVVEHRPDLQ
jgi:hypothetical protein